jgi:hypothetical protein
LFLEEIENTASLKTHLAKSPVASRVLVHNSECRANGDYSHHGIGDLLDKNNKIKDLNE